MASISLRRFKGVISSSPEIKKQDPASYYRNKYNPLRTGGNLSRKPGHPNFDTVPVDPASIRVIGPRTCVRGAQVSKAFVEIEGRPDLDAIICDKSQASCNVLTPYYLLDEMRKAGQNPVTVKTPWGDAYTFNSSQIEDVLPARPSLFLRTERSLVIFNGGDKKTYPVPSSMIRKVL